MTLLLATDETDELPCQNISKVHASGWWQREIVRHSCAPDCQRNADATCAKCTTRLDNAAVLDPQYDQTAADLPENKNTNFNRFTITGNEAQCQSSATVVSAEPFSHGTGTLRCLQKEMETYRHWSVSLWRDPDDVSHCRILSPDKTERRLISATLCGWRRCFVADQLWLMTRIREEEEDGTCRRHLLC